MTVDIIIGVWVGIVLGYVTIFHWGKLLKWGLSLLYVLIIIAIICVIYNLAVYLWDNYKKDLTFICVLVGLTIAYSSIAMLLEVLKKYIRKNEALMSFLNRNWSIIQDTVLTMLFMGLIVPLGIMLFILASAIPYGFGIRGIVGDLIAFLLSFLILIYTTRGIIRRDLANPKRLDKTIIPNYMLNFYRRKS